MVALPEGKYFKPAEMACRDGTLYPEEWGLRLSILFDALDVIREAWAGPLVIVSGYRTPEHNASIGGAGKSQHMAGRAVDLRPIRKALNASDIHELHHTVNDLLALGKLPAIGGVGVYPWTKRGDILVAGWVHVDTRARFQNGHIARWEGAKFGDEQLV